MLESEGLLDDYFRKSALVGQLKKSTRWLDRLEKQGKGPPRTKIGRLVLYRKSAVRDWLVGLEQSPPSPRQPRRGRQR